MSNGDPWEVQDFEPRTYFAQSQIERIEKVGQNGNTYFEMKVWLTPIEEGQAIVERTYTNFNAAWQKITVPSVQKLVQDGKIQQPKDMEAVQFVSYRWSEYRSYAKRDLDYWRERDPNKLGVDEQGRSFKPFVGLEYLDIYLDEATWHTAHEAASPPPMENGNGGSNLPDPAMDAAKAILPTIVESCGTDMAQLQERLKHAPLDVFNINSLEVRGAVAHYVAQHAGLSVEAQDRLLKEINSHFSSFDTEMPWMSTESPELVKELGDTAF